MFMQGLAKMDHVKKYNQLTHSALECIKKRSDTIILD